MSLVNLPDEILIIILKQLDLRSTYNLHTACNRVQNIIRIYGVIKTCNLSLSVMSKANILKMQFFRDISGNLKELNLCGVAELYKTVLFPAVKRLKCLTTLDVSYTNITITNFIEIHRFCPTIIDISINLSFDKSLTILRQETITPYQEAFENFSNVHFFGNLHNMLYTNLPCAVLKKAKLKKLQYTIIETNLVNSSLQCKDILHFDNFTIYFSHAKIHSSPVDISHGINYQMINKVYGCLDQMVPFDVFDFLSYEVLIIIVRRITFETKPFIFATPIFEDFFQKNCNPNIQNIEFQTINNFEVDLDGNVCVMLWNKSETKFDLQFFSDLQHKLKPMIPCCFDFSSDTPVDSGYDLYINYPHEIEERIEDARVGHKRLRFGTPYVSLNYDTVFQKNTQVQLALMFIDNIRRGITLFPNFEYLKKLTYLSLNGQVRYSLEFFNVLFRCCNNLITLRIKGNPITMCSGAIARSLPLSQSLKNMHLIDRNIDFPTFYSSMSQCPTLENVHILDTSYSINFIDASVVFKKCVNLYCFYLYIRSSISRSRKFMQILKEANQNQINVQLLSNSHIVCDTYSNVFRLDLT